MKKKTVVVLSLLAVTAVVGIYLVFNSVFPKAEPIRYPAHEEISSVSVVSNDGAEFTLDEADIHAMLMNISSARPTRKLSVNDNPTSRPYYRMDIRTQERVYRYFVYQEGNQVYIEMPYEGIYTTGSNVLDIILE